MRIRITFPTPFTFRTELAVRIGDINYGGHLGNDSVLSVLHEARMRWLAQKGYTEMQCGGCGLIMADTGIQYKGEGFYGDVLTIQIAVANITSSAFDLFYKVTTQRADAEVPVVFAKTGMVCFDYTERKVVVIPDDLKHFLEA